MEKDELIMVVKEVLRMKNLELYGLGTNFTCFGGVVPTVETYWEFIDLVEKLKKTFL